MAAWMIYFGCGLAFCGTLLFSVILSRQTQSFVPTRVDSVLVLLLSAIGLIIAAMAIGLRIR